MAIENNRFQGNISFWCLKYVFFDPHGNLFFWWLIFFDPSPSGGRTWLWNKAVDAFDPFDAVDAVGRSNGQQRRCRGPTFVESSWVPRTPPAPRRDPCGSRSTASGPSWAARPKGQGVQFELRELVSPDVLSQVSTTGEVKISRLPNALRLIFF